MSAGGSLIAEWEEYRGQQGSTPESFPPLYTSVSDIKDAFRRRAFRAALFAEWAATDPLGGIAFLREEHPWGAGQILREWIRLDPERAIAQMLGGDQNNLAMLLDAMEEIAVVAPERLASVASRAPPSARDGSSTAQDAFALFARSNPEAARAAAESITGPLRDNALAGVATAWAEKDPEAAFGWAQGMPKGKTRDAISGAVLVAWAKRDPLAALNQVELLPAVRQNFNNGLDVGAEVLGEAARKDWDGTMRWLRDNPGKLDETSLEGLSAAVSQRLTLDPIATFQSLEKSELPNAANLLASGLSGASFEKCDMMWDWLENQPASSFAKSVRGALLNLIAYKNPEAALARMETLAQSPENHDLLVQGAQSMLNGRAQLSRFEELLSKASPDVRPFLLQTGFALVMQNINGADPQMWQGRINELPPEQRENAASGLARSWAGIDPQSAATWALSLEDPAQRTNAISMSVTTWGANHAREAAEWINSLPAGPNRDTAAVSLVGALARSEPEAAWTWALSVESPEQRTLALHRAFSILQQKDPALAQQMVRNSGLPAAEATALLRQLQQQ